jgi:hypothetical protein
MEPKNRDLSHATTSGKLEDIRSAANVQWAFHPKADAIEVDHLYSTFIYKKEAAKHSYCEELSPAGHREETIFSHEIKRAGWKLLVNPSALTWHVRQSAGGIRAYSDKPKFWDADEKVFDRKLKAWQILPNAETKKIIVLDNGMGDHIIFKTILPDVRKKHAGKQIVLATCYPELFEDEKDIQQISIYEARMLFHDDISQFDVYRYCEEHQWKKPLAEAFKAMYCE